MHHRGLGMRTLGRLVMAAALIVPVGAVIASPAGAANPNHATCSGTFSINSNLTNNGVGDHGGLLYTVKGSQQFTVNGNGACSGGIVSSVHIHATVTTATASNCQTISATTLGGNGHLTWNTGMGQSGISALFKFGAMSTNGAQAAHLHGGVTNAGSTTDTFGGNTVTINTSNLNHGLKTVLSGGACQATIPLTSFSGHFSLSI
jgi:hypothetical protein